jgi:phosphatidylglycerophosphate synthase
VIGLLAALLAQQVFLWLMQRKIGPEASTVADVLTLARAATGSVLAGLVVADIEDRSGVGGWIAWSLSVLSATLGDWLDGPLARCRGPTRLGQVLDIEADSWLTLWSAAGAIVWGGLPWWCLLAPLLHYAHPIVALWRGDLPAGGDPWWGRVTGVAQMVLFIAALAPLAGPLRDQALRGAALPISGAQVLVMLTLLLQRIRHKAPSPVRP